MGHSHSIYFLPLHSLEPQNAPASLMFWTVTRAEFGSKYIEFQIWLLPIHRSCISYLFFFFFPLCFNFLIYKMDLILLRKLTVFNKLSSVCICSVAKLCLTLYDRMDCSMPCFPVPHHLPEFAQVHVHWVSNSIEPSHPLPPSSTSAFNISQHQDLFQWVNCSH